MKAKKLLLTVLSRGAQGFGIGVSVLSLLAMAWFVFFSYDELKYLWGGCCAIGVVAGYYIYKLAILKIFDDRLDDW